MKPSVAVDQRIVRIREGLSLKYVIPENRDLIETVAKRLAGREESSFAWFNIAFKYLQMRHPAFKTHRLWQDISCAR